MLTIFACPKPFTDPHIAIIQRNAIRSWTLLRPACEIILFGNDEGTAQVAAELGVRHVPDVARNGYGTPLVNDLFKQAQRLATHDLLCYVNADIILMSDFMQTVQRVARRRRRFLMVGQRWDVDLDQPWGFDHPDWENRLREHVHNHGVLHPSTGIDYFLFTPGLWETIPPFAIGRTAWDNWLIYSAHVQGAAVVDATRVLMVVHQNHHYAHIPYGVKGVKEEVWKGVEAQRNLALAGGHEHLYTIDNATWLLTSCGLVPAWTRRHLARRWEVFSMPGKRFIKLALMAYREGQLYKGMKYSFKVLPYFPLLFLERGVVFPLLKFARAIKELSERCVR